MFISISVIIFYITCVKGSITSKGDLAMEYFWVQRNLMQVGMDVWLIPR